MKKNMIFSLVPFFALQSSMVLGHYGQASDGYNQGGYNQGGYNQSPYNQSNDYYNQSNPNNQSNDYYNQSNQSSDYYNQNNRNSSQPYNNRSQNSNSYDQNSQYNNSSNFNGSQNGGSSYGNGSSYSSRPYLSQADYSTQRSTDTKDQTYSEKNYPQDSYSSEMDRQINGKIRKAITGWVTDSYKNIALSTNNGVVTLSGYVANIDDTTKLVNEIRKIDGVRSVTNNVQVKQ